MKPDPGPSASLDQAPAFKIAIGTGAYFALLVVVSVGVLELPLAGLVVFSAIAILPLCGRRFRPVHEPFYWVKLYSVLAGAIAILAAAARVGPGHAVWEPVILAIVAINIIEAATADLIQARWANGLAGVLLVATMPTEVSVVGDSGRLEYQAPLAWLLIYSGWNWTFIAARVPSMMPMHSAVLLAPFFLLPPSSALWLESRAVTLGLHLAIALVGEPRRATFVGPRATKIIGAATQPLGWITLSAAATYLSIG